MIETTPGSPPSSQDADLPEFLGTRARGASDARLAVDTSVGLIAVVVPLIWPFPYWFFVLAAGGCFLGFGAWGIADRELIERGAAATPRQVRLFRLVKTLATIVGAASAAALAIGVMAKLIGRLIS